MNDNGSRDIVKRDTNPYPTDVKVEAIALVYESGNFSEATRIMADRYPDRHPARQLIFRWFKQVDPETFSALCTERKESFQTGIMEMADKAQEKMYEVLDILKAEDVHIPAGIAMDKGLKLLEIERGGGRQLNVQFNLVSQAGTLVKEGEA